MAPSEAQNALTIDDLRENASSILSDSLTSRRVPALKLINRYLTSKDDLSLVQDKPLVQTLTMLVLKSYNYYQDAASRTEAALVLENLAQLDEDYAKAAIKYINAIALKLANLALTGLVSLLTWSCMLVVVEGQRQSAELSKALTNLAILLENCVEASLEGGKLKSTHKKRVLEASLAQTKNTLIQIFTRNSPDAVDQFVKNTISDSTISPSAATLFLAVLAEALHDLQSSHPAYIAHLKESELSSSITNFFAEKVVLAKTGPSAFAISYFTKWYLDEISTRDEFVKKILPNLEKAILRSSEIGFCHLMCPIFENKSDTIDLSDVFATSKILSHIISGVKSTKEHVRDKAAKSLILIFKNALPKISSADAAKVMDEIVKAFKGTTNPDAKILLAKSLNDINVHDVSGFSKMFSSLLPLAAKELNEGILHALTGTLISQFVSCLRYGYGLPSDEVTKVETQIKAGLSNAKLNLRSIWATQLGNALYRSQEENDDVVSLFKLILPELTKSLEEAILSPLLTVSNKGIACAYVAIAISHKFVQKN